MSNPFDELMNEIRSLRAEVQRISGNSPDGPEDLLNVKQVAELLDLTEATVYLKARSGQIPSHKKHSRLYFLRSEVIESIREKEIYPADLLIKTKRKRTQ